MEPGREQPKGSTPTKRRRSGAVPPGSTEAVSIAELQSMIVPQRVTLRAFLLAVPIRPKGVEMKMSAKSLVPQSKSVVTLLVGDSTGCIQLALWGEKAEEYHAQLLDAAEKCPDGSFQTLQLEGLEVVSVKGGMEGLGMRKLQSTGALTIQFLEVKALTMTPAKAILVTDFNVFGETIKAPLHVHLHGVVDMVGPMKYTRDGVEMLELRVTDPVSKKGIPLMLYGENATQTIPCHRETTFFYVEFKSPLPGREDEGGYGWCYDTAFVVISDTLERGDVTCKEVIRVC